MPDRADEAKEGLATALAQDGDLGALHALRWALVWSARVMGRLPDGVPAEGPDAAEEAERGERGGGLPVRAGRPHTTAPREAEGSADPRASRLPEGPGKAGEPTGPRGRPRRSAAPTAPEAGPASCRSSTETSDAPGEPARPARQSARCLEAVFLLDDALTEAGGVSRAAGRLLAAARPGPAAEAYLREREAELDEVKGRTAAARADFDSLAEAEEELRRRLAEHAALRERVAELRRLERLVEALDALDGQHAAVEERLAFLRARVDGAEETMAEDSAELLRLTRDQLTLLSPRARTALERAAAAQAELASAEGELAGSEKRLAAVSARLAEVGVLRRERLSSLSARTRADRELADALASLPELWKGSSGGGDGTAPDRARALLDGIEERLRDVEAALRRTLDEEESAPVPGRTVLDWRDGGPAGAAAR
ncbi:hypothetical protein [Streptomyces albireticuli]|uniref:Uncharacterized protein n=1 Tax=Streptomyces albireticuli TaxID=1940 RepID=A0A2A2CV02_9ACTN|nr:hypothetical protein [Streptomyces albireticuli]MCD9194381.1 hypothetical protein [Streptomyces albireticuli]PAU44038.1 hypothetical protein CK936_37035 [Streptomyces albireticuli]